MSIWIISLFVVAVAVYALWWMVSEVLCLRESRDFWRDATDRVWELRQKDWKLIDRLIADLLTYIKAHNLVCEENIVLIRSVKEAQQETALANRIAEYWGERYDEVLFRYEALEKSARKRKKVMKRAESI